MRQKIVTIAVLLTAFIGWVAVGSAAPPRDLRGFMRMKLQQSQKGLEGLVRGDLAIVTKTAEDMKALTLDETWQVLTTSEYIAQSRKFREAADALSASAKSGNLEKSTAAFNQVTARCVECHKYVRDVRMVNAGQ
jgi:hypothetical protein